MAATSLDILECSVGDAKIKNVIKKPFYCTFPVETMRESVHVLVKKPDEKKTDKDNEREHSYSTYSTG